MSHDRPPAPVHPALSDRSDSTLRRCMAEPLAIIGLSGRYPKAPDLDTLWANLTGGVDAVGEGQGDRWDLGHYAIGSDNPERCYTNAGGFLDRIDLFDAEFFGLSPREAKQIDPQHRLMLELTWEAFEQAGLVPVAHAGSNTGVYIGISGTDYASLQLNGDPPDAYTNIGSALSIAANRISYAFDFHGPSLSIDTACSSAMVAIHQAGQALAKGEIDMAVAGGVNLLISPRPFAGFARASMLSPDGRCKSFDASGRGYVRAEGGGIILIKRLADAERDGDPILAVIRATGVNSDGRTMGLALPNGAAQEALLRDVYGAIGLRPDDVFYVEAHGTGTAAGDPIECGAIGRVLGAPRRGDEPCLIGSVKSNIGHLESGAAIAGITKVLLALRHRALPPNLHFTTPNPKIDFDGWKLKVVTETTSLPDRATPLLFGINSFGFGGTNGHMVLQDYRPPAVPAEAAPSAASGWDEFLVLSAHNQAALDALAARSIDRLQHGDAQRWRAIRAASLRCRSLHPLRLALTAASADEAAALLRDWRDGHAPQAVTLRKTAATVAAGSQKLAFVFSGNGPQWWGMGRELLAECPAYRAAIEAVDRIFAPLAGWSLLERMTWPEESVAIERTEIAQPMLFAQQVGLVTVLREAAIEPDLVFGHSVGEAAAAWASGALSLEQATRVIFHRSHLQARTQGAGKMAAVGIGAEEARALIAALGLEADLDVAASNAPRAATIAGSPAGLAAVEARMAERGQFYRQLALDYAFHTNAMDPIEAPLRAALAGLQPGAAHVPMISGVTGAAIAGEALDAGYWWQNIRRPVAFAAATQAAAEHGIGCFLEIGPHPVLRDYVLQVAKELGRPVSALATLRRPSAALAAAELATLRLAVAETYAAGAGRPERLFPGADRTLALPGLQWQRQRHWRGLAELPDAVQLCVRDHGLLGARTPGADGVWTNTIHTQLHPYLADHVVQDAPIFPAAGYIEMFIAAARRLIGDGPVSVEAFEILRPLELGGNAEPITQTTMDGADGTFAIRSRADRDSQDWTIHVKGRISKPEGTARQRIDLDRLRATLPQPVTAEAHYAACGRRGLHYGPGFRGVRQLWLSAPGATRREALGEVSIEGIGTVERSGHHAHPSLVDGALQAVISLIAQNDPRPAATIPVFVDRIVVHGDAPAHIICHIALIRESDRSGVADITILDRDGQTVMELFGARFRKVEFNPPTLILTAEDWRTDPSWTPRPTPALVLPPLAALADAAQLAPAADLPALRDGIDRLAGAHAAVAVAHLSAGMERFTIASLALAAEVVDEQRPLLRALVAFAEADGHVERDEASGLWRIAGSRPDPAILLRALMLAHPAWAAELVALSAAGAGLETRLRGEHDGRVAMAELLEDGAPSRAPANAAAARLLAAVAAQLPQGRPLRVLECDGGTGGLTAALLGALPPERTDYLFTDPDEGAVARAAHRFAAHHFLRTATTAPASIASDQVPADAFDVVVTGRLADAGALARHLAPGGLLIALHTLPSRLWTLVHGVADGAPQARSARLGEQHLALASTGPLGAELLLARCSPLSDHAVVPATSLPAARPCSLLISATEVGTPFIDRLRAALGGADLRVIGAEDLTDEAMAALVAADGARDYVHGVGWNRVAPLDDATALLAYQDLRTYSLAPLVRAMASQAIEHPHWDGAPRLQIVTRGALAGMGTAPLDPFQATAVGFARVLANESPSLSCRVIDVHAEPGDEAAALDLARSLLENSDEAEMQLIGGQRFVNRVRRTDHAEQARIAGHGSGAGCYRLECRAAGGLDSLGLAPATRRAPAHDEVEVRVAAAGLNFRDVLWAMGMLPEEAVEAGFSGATIGMECAGTVERVGASVQHVRPGDRVMGFASNTFATHVTTRADGVGRLPEPLSFNEGATIPTTFITAWYALVELARLQPGETVLIHGAAGGVGLAALQIAKLRGATVFATAGAADKQRLVRDMGADHVLSSRSLAFAEQVMALTGGEGVDVVLNSLAGEAIARGLGLLKPFGRFLEIGKRDLYANSRIGLRPFRRNLSYFGIDADTLLVERPAMAARLFAEISALFADGRLRPLPHSVFPLDRAAEAFRLMQASRHVGKIVLAVAPPGEARSVPMLDRPPASDGTWLLTGGLSGFGLATAQWLADRGVKHLALLGRRGGGTPEATACLDAFAQAGVDARAYAVDVADPDALAATLATIRQNQPALRGVVHAAAVIEDAPIITVSRDLAHRVQAAKMQGAWNLHRLTAGDPLDAFVLYSSSSAVVGNPGQAIYVGANLFLDALAQARRAAGLPALSVGWGAIKDAGFLTRNTQVEEMLAARAGMGATPAAEALAELDRLLAVDATRVAVSQFNLLRLGQVLPATRRPRFQKLVPQGVSVSSAQGGTLGAELEAMSEETRLETLTVLIREHVARVIGAAASQIEAERTLAELGLDSLMAVELAETLEQELGRPVSVMQLIQAGSVNGIVTVLQRSFRAKDGTTQAASLADAA